jgi:hypothetical protein
VLLDICIGFFPGIDLLPKLLGLRMGTPIHMFTDKRHVPVVGLSGSVKYSDPLTRESEVLRVQRRVRRSQDGGIQPMLFIFG